MVAIDPVRAEVTCIRFKEQGRCLSRLTLYADMTCEVAPSPGLKAREAANSAIWSHSWTWPAKRLRALVLKAERQIRRLTLLADMACLTI